MARSGLSLAVSLAGVSMGVDMSGIEYAAPPNVSVPFTAQAVGRATALVTLNSSGADAPPAGFSYMIDAAGNYLVDSTGAYLIGVDR